MQRSCVKSSGRSPPSTSQGTWKTQFVSPSTVASRPGASGVVIVQVAKDIPRRYGRRSARNRMLIIDLPRSPGPDVPTPSAVRTVLCVPSAATTRVHRSE